MANRFWYDKVKTLLVGRADISGSFRPNSISGIVAGSVYGRGYSVARTSAGLYTITLDDQYAKLIACKASIRVADATPTICQFGDYVAASRTIQLRVLQAADVSATQGKGFIPLPLHTAREMATNDYINASGNGGLLASDTTPLIQRTNGATDIAGRLVWAAGNSDEIQWAGIPYPPDLDDTQAMTVALWLEKDTNTDTAATVAVKFFEGKGDTNAGGNTAELSAATLGRKTVSIAAGDIGAAPNFFNVAVVPGTHAADAIRLYAAGVEYTKIGGGPSAAFALTDLASDVDAVVNFELTMSVSGVD